MPAEFRAEAVVRAMAERGDVSGASVLLPHADIGREVIADAAAQAWRRRHARSWRIGRSRSSPNATASRTSTACCSSGSIDVVTFTSPSAVRNFVHVLGAEPAADLLRSTVVASIGPVTAEAAAQCQHRVDDRAGDVHDSRARGRDRRALRACTRVRTSNQP